MSKGAVPITGCITPTSDLDTYPTHWDKYGLGGFRTVTDSTQRNAIPLERRTEGMQVYVCDIKQLHQLIGGTDNTKWVTLLTIDSNNKIIVNNDVNLQKYVIQGPATSLLPNAIALESKADGYLVNNSGIVDTTRFIDPSGLALSEGKVLIGSALNKAVETQTFNINNLPAGDLTMGGMIKYDSNSSLLQIATPDTDYATVITLNKLAAAAAKSANDADASASAASKFATTAGGAASEATAAATFAEGYKELADGYAKTAGEYAGAAFGSAGLAAGSAGSALDDAGKASGFADTAKAASTVALDSRDKAQASADSAQKSLDTLLKTGLNSLPNSGDVNFQGYRGINAADGIDPTDLATVRQISGIGTTYVKTVSGTDNISSSGGQEPVIDLLPTLITPGTYNLSNVTFDMYGRGTNATSTVISGVANRTNVTGSGTTKMTIDLVDTGVVAGGYLLSNIEVGKDGRLTAAAGTTINGTANRVSVSGSGTSTITLDLVNTAVTPGSYNLSNITLDSAGRATAATSTIIKGVTGRTIVSGSGTAAMTIDLVNTAVTPGSYNLSNITFDSSGRATAATSTTINGVTGRIAVSGAGTSSMTIDLVNTAVTPGSYTCMNATVGADGRVTAASSTTPVLTVSGTSGSITSTGGQNPILDLATAGTPKTTYLSYMTTDKYGRVTNSVSTSLLGTDGRVSVSDNTLSKITFDLVDTGVTAGTYNNMTATIGADGRITSATSGTGGVTNVIGTANRITITGTTQPAIDIASNYVGQTSITKLGTITTGNWNASIIPQMYGGTGAVTGASTANQLPVSTGAGTAAWGSTYIDYGATYSNLFVGYGSGKVGITGVANTSFGPYSLVSISTTISSRNAAFGASALNVLVNGSNNTALGAYCGSLQNKYNNCTFVGYGADADINDLTNATAVGANALVRTSNSLVLGSGANVGIGTSSPKFLLSLGNPSAAATSGGMSNVHTTSSIPSMTMTGTEYHPIGTSSNEGVGLSLGLNRTGFRALCVTDTALTKNSTNAMIRMSVQTTLASIESVSMDQGGFRSLGLNASTITSNTDAVYKPSGGSWLASSDKRVKKNIKKSDRGLKEILQLNPVNFQFNNHSGFDDETKSKINTGLIADEVEKVMPECIGTLANNKFGEIRSLDITPITHALINAVKELNDKVIMLENKIKTAGI